ncbi:MAG TPA: YetF domain-containing protein [Nitrososphaera sp.]|nr:YetF domain-containing protein [Nitrososphaera sp.]
MTPLQSWQHYLSSFPFFVLDFFNSALAVDLDIILSVILRTAIITAFVFLVIRWMRHKGSGQLNMYELLIVIGLGAAIGEPMIYVEELTLTQSFAAIVVVIAVFKLIDYLTIKNKRFRRFAEEEPVLLVSEGEFVEEGLEKTRITKGELVAHMRMSGI